MKSSEWRRRHSRREIRLSHDEIDSEQSLQAMTLSPYFLDVANHVSPHGVWRWRPACSFVHISPIAKPPQTLAPIEE
jgi:hypothetical protein